MSSGAHPASQASSPGMALAGKPSRAGADHVRRPLDEHDPLRRLGRRVGNQAKPGAARGEHLRRTLVGRRVAQHAAQPGRPLVADRDQHAAALPATAQLQKRRARSHTPVLAAQHARWPQQTHKPSARLPKLPLIHRQARPSGRRQLAGKPPASAASDRDTTTWARALRVALGQALGNLQLERLARVQAACERCVIRATLGAAPPAVPRAGLDIHRAGRVAVPARVRVGIGEAAHRCFVLRPARQLDAKRLVEAAHIGAG